MLAGPVIRKPGQLPLVLSLVHVDEHLQYGGGGHELGLYDASAGLVGTRLVYLLAAGHSEGHDQLAALLFDEQLAGHRQVLYAGHGTAY